MNNEQLNFLDHYLNYVQVNYPPRYMRGIKKYKSTLTEDYTAEELIDNALEEILDNMAYSLAALKRVERLNARISELEDENAKLKGQENGNS